MESALSPGVKTSPAEEVRDERARAARALWAKAHAAAADKAVAARRQAADAEEDDDVAARTPKPVGLGRGDEQWRGEDGVVGAAAAVGNGYWGAPAHGAYYGVKVPAGLRGGQDFLARIPGGSAPFIFFPARDAVDIAEAAVEAVDEFVVSVVVGSPARQTLSCGIG